MSDSSWKRSKPARRNCPTCFTDASATTLGAVTWSKCRRYRQIPKHLQTDRLDQTAALPLGSRIAVDPWSDRIEMLKRQPVRPLSAAEKMPLEVSPFFPYLKRLNGNEKAQAGIGP